MRNAKILTILLLLLEFCNVSAFAKGREFTITIKDHQFSPAELFVPTHEKIKLIIVNQDQTPEEFESYDLNREKIVAGNGKINVFIGPLKPGTYKFFGEFNIKTAQGVIIATDEYREEEK